MLFPLCGAGELSACPTRELAGIEGTETLDVEGQMNSLA